MHLTQARTELSRQLITTGVLPENEELHDLPAPSEPDGQPPAHALGIEELQSEQPSAGPVTGQDLRRT